MIACQGYAARKPHDELAPFAFERRDLGPNDVLIVIEHCGVCHSDIHMVNDDWGISKYPLVPGHEIVGIVLQVGHSVTKFEVGQRAAVGCLVGSCGICDACQAGEEQYCTRAPVWTYSSPDEPTGKHTQGGYSNMIVVNEAFAFRVPASLDPAAAAPLLCAGITTYAPLKHWDVGRGDRLGVVGLGGLGHMAIKFGRAFGADVTLFTHSPGKADDARRLGAQDVVISSDANAMAVQANRFDFILDTVSAPHDVNGLLPCLKRDGYLVLVGLPGQPMSIMASNLTGQRRSLAGSTIGGIRQTQEMLDYCGEKRIVCDVERIPIQKINDAYRRMNRSDVKYRFVIDLASLEDGRKRA